MWHWKVSPYPQYTHSHLLCHPFLWAQAKSKGVILSSGGHYPGMMFLLKPQILSLYMSPEKRLQYLKGSINTKQRNPGTWTLFPSRPSHSSTLGLFCNLSLIRKCWKDLILAGHQRQWSCTWTALFIMWLCCVTIYIPNLCCYWVWPFFSFENWCINVFTMVIIHIELGAKKEWSVVKATASQGRWCCVGKVMSEFPDMLSLWRWALILFWKKDWGRTDGLVAKKMVWKEVMCTLTFPAFT